MQRIIFLVYHGTGHFNAFFKLAKILQWDHEVIFAGVEFFQKYVISQGFQYHALRSVPFGMGFEHWVSTIHKSKLTCFSALRDRYNDALYHHREKELADMMERLAPHTVFIDSFQSTDFIVLYGLLKKHASNVILVHTALPSILQRSLPPINSLVLPGDGAEIRRAHFKHFVVEALLSIGSRIKYLGFNNQYIINRRKAKNNVPESYFSHKKSLLTTTLQNIPELILSNKEFDFPGNANVSHQHYIGFMPDNNRIEVFDTEFLEAVSALHENLSEKNRPLVYCSFGTVKPTSAKGVRSFLKRLVQVCAVNEYALIISSEKTDLTLQRGLKNIYIFKRVPQLDVLSMADVFITHGGLNSIKEAVYAEVPMLVYMAGTYFDQRGNSSRVVYHQLGLRGNLKEDTEQDIATKIEDLLNNPVYKQKLAELKQIDLTYTPENVLKLFQEVIGH